MWLSLTIRSKVTLCEVIRGRLTERAEELFRMTPFGRWLDVRSYGGDAMLINLFLRSQTPIWPRGVLAYYWTSIRWVTGHSQVPTVLDTHKYLHSYSLLLPYGDPGPPIRRSQYHEQSKSRTFQPSFESSFEPTL